jgi:hypothetical protein
MAVFQSFIYENLSDNTCAGSYGDDEDVAINKNVDIKATLSKVFILFIFLLKAKCVVRYYLFY